MNQKFIMPPLTASILLMLASVGPNDLAARASQSLSSAPQSMVELATMQSTNPTQGSALSFAHRSHTSHTSHASHFSSRPL